METYDRDGISFRYPAGWVLSAEDGADGWTATVESPGTAFVVVALRTDADDPADLAAQTLAALTGEYAELEADEVVEAVAGRPAVGHDIDFLTLDIATHCRTRCLDTLAGPLLLMAQVSDLDRAAHDPALRAVVASVRLATSHPAAGATFGRSDIFPLPPDSFSVHISTISPARLLAVGSCPLPNRDT